MEVSLGGAEMGNGTEPSLKFILLLELGTLFLLPQKTDLHYVPYDWQYMTFVEYEYLSTYYSESLHLHYYYDHSHSLNTYSIEWEMILQ